MKNTFWRQAPLWLLVGGLTMIYSCNHISKKDKLFTLLDADDTGISFTNTVEDQKDFNVFTYRNFYNGGGVSIGDINNDGLADIYFTANLERNKLYLNKGNWQFEDISEKAGVGGTKSWSTGVTMADVNGDGWLDIYVCNSGDLKGDNKENELFINNGDLTFTERAKEFGLNNQGYSTHASFFDYDLDGDLDCYLLNNSFKTVDRVEQFLVTRDVRDDEGGDKLLRNDNGVFKNVSEESGIYESAIGFGLGVSVSDLNEDMLPDIYISNDFWERDYLYINKGNGKFSEELISRTGAVSGSSMGADVADLNNDGYPEVFTTEMLPGDNHRLKTMARFEETNVKELKVRSSYHYQFMQNCLHLNDGTANFQEIAFLSNTATTDWSWGALMFDMDNNGWKDIFISNGIYRDITSMDFIDFVSDRDNVKRIVQEKGKFDYKDLLDQISSSKLPNCAFINRKDLTFKNYADSLGLSDPSFSNGSAYGDLDNDGDLDLVVNNLNMPCFIYRNNAQGLKGSHFLKLKFKGPQGNSFGIGVKVIAYTGHTKQVLQNYNTRGFESSVEPQLLLGLGEVTNIDSVVVIWPDLKKQVLPNVKSDQVLSLDYQSADAVYEPAILNPTPLLKDITQDALKGNYAHKENNFNDFDVERLMLRKVSTEGPKILKGDLNGDKLEDFMLLGAYGDPDKLFFQKKNGLFEQQLQRDLLKDSIYESTCGVFFDRDNDGDLDVLIGSGGNEFQRGVGSHLLRYYENDGRGNLTKILLGIPRAIGNFSCILAEDFDGDGDQDIFVGGRIVPGNYGLRPRSFLFKNEKDQWINVAPESLSGAGMVTGAVWSDFDNDSKKDLVVVGEWMPVLVFHNTGAGLKPATPLPGTEGLWTSIEKADLNNDGIDDYILGNWGLNSKLRASAERPLTMYVNDFDHNGKSEFIINWYPPLEDKSFPFASKMDMTGQLPMLKKNVLKYEDYAKGTYRTLFNAEQRKNSDSLKVTYLQSAVLLNRGNLKFNLHALPLEAQVAPVFAIVVDDFTGDKKSDLFLGGNFYGLKTDVGRLDANHGVILKGDGEGSFTNLPYYETGFRVMGEVRDVKILNIPGKSPAILLGRNNAKAVMFQTGSSNLP